MNYDPKAQWYPEFVKLQEMLKKPDNISDVIGTLSYLHSQLHSSEIYDSERTYYDEISVQICKENFSICPRKTNMTIAWDIWHITRIEDLTVSILLCRDDQVFDSYKDKLGTSVADTGNAMTDEEVFSLGKELSISELLAYRKAVGRKTKGFIEKLTLDELKRTFPEADVQRIKSEGGVTEQTEGLMYYWGKKNVSGIITMPMTKHQIMHLNDCMKIIDWYNKRHA